MILIRTRIVPGGFSALALWPFLFIRPEAATDAALVAHEKVHLQEQARWLVLPWWLAYLASRRFRLAAEVRAYRVQIAYGLDPERAAQLLTTYRTGANLEQARELLVAAAPNTIKEPQ